MKLAEKILQVWGPERKQADLARRAGISPSRLSKILQGGNTSFEIGVKLAKALGVPAEWLGDESDERPPPASDEQQAVEMIREVLSGAGLAGELDDREREIVAVMRVLDEPARREIVAYARGLRDAGRGEATAPSPEEVYRKVAEAGMAGGRRSADREECPEGRRRRAAGGPLEGEAG